MDNSGIRGPPLLNAMDAIEFASSVPIAGSKCATPSEPKNPSGFLPYIYHGLPMLVKRRNDRLFRWPPNFLLLDLLF